MQPPWWNLHSPAVSEVVQMQIDAPATPIRPSSSSSQKRDASTLFVAAAVGAAAMYFLDPQRGARRQKRVRDRAVHAAHKSADFLGAAGRDTANRVRGIASEASHKLGDAAPDDRVLEERVRAELGRAVSHPGAIEVTAADGIVVLRGPVLERERDDLLECVRRVRGVDAVEEQLDVHESAENIPALQGGTHRTGGERFELAQSNWTPAVRLMAGLAGAALTSYGARQRGLIGAAFSAGGLALLTRAATNLELDRVVGVGGGRLGIEIQKTINIAAPMDEVFAFFTDWERWPEWMAHVRSVSVSGPKGAVGERTRWVVDGPAGTKVSWDAEVTELIPNERVSWRTAEGSVVRQAGRLRFDQNEDGTVRVEIQMTYNPPAGAAGHLVAKVFGRDPKRQMDEDLARLKTTIEAGIPPHDAAARQT